MHGLLGRTLGTLLPAGGLALVLVLAGIPSGAAAEPAVQLPPSDRETPNEDDATLLASPTTIDHIGRVVVPVMVNGQGPFRFIVDTGASHSTISPDLVRRLGLTPGQAPSILLDGITGSAQVSAVTVDRLEAGRMSVEDVALPVVWAPLMAGADGILGAAGLSDQSLVVDFRRNRVVISATVEPAVRAAAMRIHAMRQTDGLMTVSTMVGGVRVRTVIDTGSERSLANLALRNALGPPPGPGVGARVTTVYGATKQVEPGEVRVAPMIAIERLRIADVQLVFGNFHIFKVWGMENEPAMIIGMDVLGTVESLGIDFKSHDVYLTSSRATGGDALSAARAYGSDKARR